MAAAQHKKLEVAKAHQTAGPERTVPAGKCAISSKTEQGSVSKAEENQIAGTIKTTEAKKASTIYYTLRSSIGVTGVYCTTCDAFSDWAYQPAGSSIAFWVGEDIETAELLCGNCVSTREKSTIIRPLHRDGKYGNLSGDIPASRSLPRPGRTEFDRLYLDHAENVKTMPQKFR